MGNDKLNWYEIALNSISNVISKFISTFKKNGFVFSLGCAIVFVLVYCTIVNPINVGRIVEKKFMEEKEKAIEENEIAVQRRMEADEILGGIMTRLTDKYPEIQRVLLLEGHNGTKTFGNVDLLFMTCTLEMLTSSSRNLEYVADDLQRQIKQNLLGGFNNTLKHRDYLFYEDISNCNHPNHRLFIKLKAVGDKEALLIPYLDKNHVVQLLLVITGENLPVEEIIDYTKDFKSQIENCLM